MILEKDFVDFLKLLNEYEVEYLVIGGYALGFHGFPRTTGDIDIWINRTEANAKKMIGVIDEFGFSALVLIKKDLLEKGIITQLGYPPLRIDILNEIDGVEFIKAVKNKLIFQAAQIPVTFIGIEDFIKNKEASGRRKDLIDLKQLKKKAGKK